MGNRCCCCCNNSNDYYQQQQQQHCYRNRFIQLLNHCQFFSCFYSIFSAVRRRKKQTMTTTTTSPTISPVNEELELNQHQQLTCSTVGNSLAKSRKFSPSSSLSSYNEQVNRIENECQNRPKNLLPWRQESQNHCHHYQQESISTPTTNQHDRKKSLVENSSCGGYSGDYSTKKSLFLPTTTSTSGTNTKLKNQRRIHYRLIEHQASTQSSPSHTSSYSNNNHHHCPSHHFNHRFSHHPDSNNSIIQSPTLASYNLRSKLRLDLQRYLDEMIQRQRSASHCPHAVAIGSNSNSKSGTSMNKCCCCQKARNISANNNSGSPKNSGNIVVDPLMCKMVQQHGLSPSPSSSNINGQQKRASSLRVLNRRFNFFDTSSTNYKTDGTSSRNGSRRGSRKQKRQQIKMMDLSDECFLAIFDFLTLQEKLYYERVCHRWQRLIRVSLQASASLKIGEHSVKCNCQCAHFPSWDLPPSKRFPRDQIGYIIYPKTTIRYLLTLCSQLRCINFSHCYLDDETLQIIMNHSDKIECLHLNDIRLEEDGDELPNGFLDKNKNLIEAVNNGHHGDQETISSAVGAFASEQLAVFGGLMRKLSTRHSLKKKHHRKETSSDIAGKRYSNASVLSKKSTASSVSNLVQHRSSTGVSSPSSTNHSTVASRCKTPVNQTKSSPISSSGTNNSGRTTAATGRRTNEMSPLIQSTMNRTTPNLNISMTTNTASTAIPMNSVAAAIHEKTTAVYFPHDDMRVSLENIIRKTQMNNNNNKQQNNKTPSPQNGSQSPTITFHPAQSQSLSSQQQQQKLQSKPSTTSITSATQRRREWSKHRSSQNNQIRVNNSVMRSEDQLMSINVINDTINSNDSLFTLNDESSVATNSYPKTNGNRQQIHLSPNLAPNISSIQTDSDGTSPRFNTTITTTTTTSQSGGSSSGGSGASMMTGNQIADLNSSEINSNSHRSSMNLVTNVQSQGHSNQMVFDSLVSQMDNNKRDHVQAYVEQEQIRHEIRQSHLLQWKAFAKKLGSQIRCLSLGSLSSVDSIVIDILLKYSTILEELRINNEIDILSYLSVIKHTIKKIYINCEHGIGLECVTLLAYRNYAEKVISLGRVDVPPDLMDSVISTIGSNFCNLQSLYLRIHNFDIDVATPASLLFNNLNELNLQFVSGNVDQPFRKFIQLGWSSVRSLTIQYASITEESVRAIHEHMPQLRKLVLYAIEFRCDHLARRYGHRICTNCSHSVWKSIATLPHLQHLKLHRVIIDEEICKALSRMHRLQNLELQYCSNVNDNVINVCSELARRSPRRRFILAVISRGFLTLKPPADCNNLFIDVKVACK